MSDIYQEEIKNCCRQLRLSANLAERAQTTSGETNQEFLYNLLRDEIAYRRWTSRTPAPSRACSHLSSNRKG